VAPHPDGDLLDADRRRTAERRLLLGNGCSGERDERTEEAGENERERPVQGGGSLARPPRGRESHSAGASAKLMPRARAAATSARCSARSGLTKVATTPARLAAARFSCVSSPVI